MRYKLFSTCNRVIACWAQGCTLFISPLCVLMACLPVWQHPISLQGQRLCGRKFSVQCPCVLRALCQDLRSLARAGVGIGGPLRPAAFEYLGGRYVIMFRAANEFWKSGNLGRQPETRKGVKLGGCLRKQGVGKIKPTHQLLVCWAERCAVARHAAPPHPWVCRVYILPPAAAGRDALNPKP